MHLLRTGFILSCIIFFGQWSNSDRLFAQKCYKGWADDVFPIKICLDLSDTNDVDGNYSFIHTDLSFDLQGFRKGDTIQLVEFDERGLISGFLYLRLRSDEILGTWTNTARSIESRIQCYDPEKKFVSDNCGANKWIKSIEFTTAKDRVMIVLIRTAQHIAYGHLIGPDGGQHHIRGNCLDRVCSELSIERSAAAGTPKKLLFQGRDRAVLIGEDGVKNVGRVQDIWSLNCRSKITYTGSVDIHYPVIDEVFEKFIGEHVYEWMQEIDFRRKLEFGEPSDLPENRWANRYYSWLEIDLINEHFISGILELIGPDGGIKGVAFNYNAERKEFLDVERYLKGNLDLEDLSASAHGFIDNHIPDWKYITVSHNGIVLRTAYDPIFGFQKTTLRFEEHHKQIKGSLLKMANIH